MSYNYGARNIPLIKKAEKVIVLMGLAFTALMFGLSFPLAAPFRGFSPRMRISYPRPCGGYVST